MKNNYTNIGFIDSGIGGATVLNECIKLNKNFKYIYYSDTKNNPYGDKEEKDIINIVENIVKLLINNNCKIIVIACNTASCVCLEYLREKYNNINFVGIEPAIKVAYDKNKLDTTLVMGTHRTLNSNKFIKNLNRFNKDKKYILHECVGLADIIEDGNLDKIKSYLENNLSQYKDIVSSVVLGCTHYPLIKNEIIRVLGDVNFYDGSIGVSQELNRIINNNNYIGNTFNIEFINSENNKIKYETFIKYLNK